MNVQGPKGSSNAVQAVQPKDFIARGVKNALICVEDSMISVVALINLPDRTKKK